MQDTMIDYLRKTSQGATSVELAELFLRFKSPGQMLAHHAILAILGKDKRCALGQDNRWRAIMKKQESGSISLRRIPWIAVHLLTRPGDASRAFHISLWNVLPEPEHVFSAWLENPASLPPDEQDMLVDPADSPQSEDSIASVAALLESRMPLYINRQQQSLLQHLGRMSSESINDEGYLLNQLFRHAGVPVPRPLTLQSCYEALFAQSSYHQSARSSGKALAECMGELLDLLARHTIETREALDREQQRSSFSVDFSGKSFSLETIAALPASAGVYAFRGEDERFLYIGKSSNLRQRVLGYFLPSEESPAKLDHLRAEAHSLTTVPCGSELEALVLEHRLIKKHAPVLNTQTEIHERKGQFKPVPDCIIVLPHAEPTKGVSFWFREGQKTRLKPFAVDFSEERDLVSEIEAFFFSEKLAPEPTDFPELEIVTRWVKRHAEDLSIVPVHRLACAQDVFEAMKLAWMEFAASPEGAS
jgi:hypothetical protein